MSLLLDALFSSVAFGHLIVDGLNSQRAVLLTYLSVPLGLTNAALGLFSTLYVISGSLVQPVFGYLTDKFGPRWIVTGGVLWMSALFSLALLAPGQIALWLLILASFGSAAFHPAGVMQATLRGRTHYSGRETTSAAYFFVFGQSGFFMGPLVGGPLLDRFGPPGLLILTLLAVPIGLNAAYQLRPALELVPAIQPVGLGIPVPTVHGFPSHSIAESRFTESGVGGSPAIKSTWRKLGPSLLPLVAFALLAAFQAWGQQNMITFVPKYLSDLGQSAGVYGAVAALFMGGSALGNALGGNLADRYGKRRVAAIALGLASIPLFLVGSVGWSPWLFLLIPLSGALTGATHSIIVVLAQRMIPSGMALASGLILGFMFSSGALGTLLAGFLADRWGLPLIFHLTGGIALAASALAASIPAASA
jgi:FSR family fosmidomycin resistance protein-like MFS transporter